VKTTELSAAASGRLEGSLAKIYSALVLGTHAEVLINGVIQASVLNTWSWLLLVVSLVPVVGMVVHSWLERSLGVWAYLHGLVAIAIMVVWPWLVIDGDQLPSEFQPWVWWMIGMAVISVGITAPIWLGVTNLFLTSLGWFLLDTSYFGGTSDPMVSLQDSVYVFLLGGTVSGLVLLTRDAARKADIANSQAIASAVAQAQTDAVERERQRIDALVHDRVLNTLLLASSAGSQAEFQSVRQMADEAIVSLETAAEEPDTGGEVTLLGLYRALRKAALKMDAQILVETDSGGLTKMPRDVAQAITEATIQALDNAVRHSRASSITLHLGSETDHDVVIEVTDNGIGFRPERVGRDRIGIQTSIRARVQAVGGRTAIESSPGSGTKVSVRWSV
jgi:signal transduction histidine kinase